MAEYFEDTSETLILSDLITGLSAFYTSDINTLAFSETLKSLEIPDSLTDSVILNEGVLNVVIKAASLTDEVDYIDAIAGSATVPLLTDTLVIYEFINNDEVIATSETLVFSETLEMLGGIDAASLSDILRLDEAIISNIVITIRVSNAIDLSDVIGSGLIGSSSDTLIASELFPTDTTTNSSEILAVSDVVASRLVVSSSFSDTLLDIDEIGYGFIQSASDALAAFDSVAGTVSVSSSVMSDTVIISEMLSCPVAIYAAVPSDTVAASDTLSCALTLVGVLSDTVLFGDTLSDAAYQVIVVVNAETGATSTYTMTPVIAGLAEYRGTLYLAGPDGLYAMDSTSDEDSDVVWTLRTGFSNLGSDMLKRILDVNILGRTEGNTLLKVVTSRSGQKQEYHYQLTAATRDTYRDGVTKVGRGLQSVYWQFALQGTGPAEIDQIKLAIESLSRRR